MLNEFPTYFDGEEVMQWSSWEEEYDVVENTYETEAGTDQVDVVRYDKLSVSCKYRCHTDWLSKFKAWSVKDSITVKMYDIYLMGYKERTMRIRNFKASPIEYSERVKDTHGVWDVSFTLEEF